MSEPKPPEFSPSSVISPVALISTTPASPLPLVLALTKPPSVRLRLFVKILIPPEFPSAPGLTTLVITELKPPESSPSSVISPVAVTSTAPASPVPDVLDSMLAPSSSSSEPALIEISPPCPCAPCSTPLYTPLLSIGLLFKPLKVIALLICRFTSAASPFPRVRDSIKAPLVSDNESASIETPPELPSASSCTLLKSAVGNSFTPSRETSPSASIVIRPAFPSPEIPVSTRAPFCREILPKALRLIAPELPTPPRIILFEILLSLRVIFSATSIAIFPA